MSKGSSDLWNYLLAIPIIPALVGLLLLLLFFPETPKALLIKNREHAAKEGKLLEIWANNPIEIVQCIFGLDTTKNALKLLLFDPLKY